MQGLTCFIGDKRRIINHVQLKTKKHRESQVKVIQLSTHLQTQTLIKQRKKQNKNGIKIYHMLSSVLY